MGRCRDPCCAPGDSCGVARGNFGRRPPGRVAPSCFVNRVPCCFPSFPRVTGSVLCFSLGSGTCLSLGSESCLVLGSGLDPLYDPSGPSTPCFALRSGTCLVLGLGLGPPSDSWRPSPLCFGVGTHALCYANRGRVCRGNCLGSLVVPSQWVSHRHPPHDLAPVYSYLNLVKVYRGWRRH